MKLCLSFIQNRGYIGPIRTKIKFARRFLDPHAKFPFTGHGDVACEQTDGRTRSSHYAFILCTSSEELMKTSTFLR